MLQRNYHSLNPSQNHTIQSSISYRTKRSRGSSFSTLEPLPGCLPFETIRLNRMHTSYNRKKQHLRELSKENIAMATRINSQKSSYKFQHQSTLSKDKKLTMNLQNVAPLSSRRISIVWKKANKQNLLEIDRILTARDKQIKKFATGKNVLA